MHLPFTEITKEVGDKVTDEELAAAKQSKESVAALIESGALLSEEQYEKQLKTQVEDSRAEEIKSLEARLAELKKEDKA